MKTTACDSHRISVRTFSLLICPVAFVALAPLLCGCGKQQAQTPQKSAPVSEPEATAPGTDISGELTIFLAASLTRPFEEFAERFEQKHSNVNVVRESGSSRLQCRKVTELHRQADIIATADYDLIPKMLIPEYADWAISSARNRIVIAYTDKSNYSDKINGENWYDVLLRDDVSYGYADPVNAPVGYRTLLVWKLADQYYKDKPEGDSIYKALKRGCPEANIRPDVQQIVPLVESMDLDYVFVYRNVALEHNLQWVKLPDKIDLSSEQYADFYANASVKLPGKTEKTTLTKTGDPCLYGVTILSDAPNRPAAVSFVEFILSKPGQQILKDSFMEPIAPAICPHPQKLPEKLQPLVKEAKL